MKQDIFEKYHQLSGKHLENSNSFVDPSTFRIELSNHKYDKGTTFKEKEMGDPIDLILFIFGMIHSESLQQVYKYNIVEKNKFR